MSGLGKVARDPSTEYLVYEFSYNGRVFYVGHAWGNVRHMKRWEYILNLVRHERTGTLKPGKAKDLRTPSNQVIAALIKADLPPHEVSVYWRGKGKANAEPVEKRRIRELVESGAILANVRDNPKPGTPAEVLRYLGVAACETCHVQPAPTSRG